MTGGTARLSPVSPIMQGCVVRTHAAGGTGFRTGERETVTSFSEASSCSLVLGSQLAPGKIRGTATRRDHLREPAPADRLTNHETMRQQRGAPRTKVLVMPSRIPVKWPCLGGSAAQCLEPAGHRMRLASIVAAPIG